MDKKTKNIILFSTADWDNPFWTNKQHTAKQLSERGYNVFYIESLGLRIPSLKKSDLLRIVKRILKFFKGAKQVNNRLWVYAPLVLPLHKYKIIRLINNILIKYSLKYYQWKFNLDRPIIWTYNPTIIQYLKYFDYSKLVYHSVDDLSSSPGIDKEFIISEEKKLITKCHYIFCTSRKIEQYCKSITPLNVYYFNNVVDFEHFNKSLTGCSPEPHDISTIPHPRIGFIGAISEYKVDFKLIKNTAIKFPNIHWVLIGKIGEGQPLTSIDEIENLPNIHFLGPKNYADLPNYIKNFEVASIPCPINDYTESMFPMKFFEYMASGKPIIASNINSLKEYNEYYYCYSSEEEFEIKLKEALNKVNFDLTKNLLLAKENTWEKRLDKMLAIINA